MNFVETTLSPLRAVGRMVASFAPASMPLLARPNYARELGSTFCFAVALAAVEGAVLSVFVKNAFEGVVPTARLNLLVALVQAAPELANILSFVWAGASAGRDKVRFINALQVAVILTVGLTAALPRTEWGLYALVGLAIAARVLWSGIVTLRPTIWRANYPRAARARMVGKFSTVQVLVVAAAAALLGKALEFNEHAYRVLVPLACVVGGGAVWFYAGVRVRGRRAMLAQEQRLAASGKPWQGPGIVWRVLKKDPWFARFQTCMFILGVSNLMLAPVLVISLRDQFGLGYLGVLITSTIPYVTMVLAIPLWARLLDRAHVVKFRSIHSWAFVVSTFVIMLASMTHRVELMYVGAVLQGLAFGGGTLAWNLGHTDFAPPSQTSEYMAAHVTLNGVRGLVAPFVAVLGIYQPALAMGASPGQAMSLVSAVTLALAVAGAIGFVLLRRQMGAMLAQVRRG